MTERRGYRITGMVQGVGFRWWTRTLAQSLDLRGTVRNEPDGSVRVRAEGAAAALDRLEEGLRAGPPASAVRGVEREEPGEDDLTAGFEIIR
jgi:acylphosphatase